MKDRCKGCSIKTAAAANDVQPLIGLLEEENRRYYEFFHHRTGLLCNSAFWLHSTPFTPCCFDSNSLLRSGLYPQWRLRSVVQTQLLTVWCFLSVTRLYNTRSLWRRLWVGPWVKETLQWLSVHRGVFGTGKNLDWDSRSHAHPPRIMSTNLIINSVTKHSSRKSGLYVGSAPGLLLPLRDARMTHPQLSHCMIYVKWRECTPPRSVMGLLSNGTSLTWALVPT